MMAKEGYKEVSIGVIPNLWEEKQTQEIGKIITGTTPRTSDKDNFGGQYPFVTPTDINNEKYINNTDRFLTKKGYDASRPIPKETVVVTCIASIGKNALTSEESCTNQQINSIVCNEKNNPHFIYYMVDYRKKYLKALAGKTSVPIVNKGEFSTFILPVAPLPEQRKIASILSSVDRSIEKTDGVIKKTKALKKGLMQELFTKGIGHSEFMEVNINGKTMKLPIGWDIKMLKDVTEINKNNISTSTSEDYTIEYIDISSINDIGKIAETTFYNYGNAPSRAKRLVNIDDVIVSTVRPYLKSFSIIEEDKENLVCSTGFAVLTPKLNMETEYIYYFAWSNHFVNYMKRLMRGTSYPAVNKSDVANTFIPVPPLSEQKKIASILSSVDAKIQKEEEYKSKLEELKKGLMQKLLTGEIRVNIESEV